MTATVLLLAYAAASSGQIVTTSEPLARATVTCDGAGCESPVAVLNRHVSRGDMQKLQGFAAELLQRLARTGPPDLRTALGDTKRNFYRLVWMGRGDGGPVSVQSVVVHYGEGGLVRALPGLSDSSTAHLIDIFISADPSAVLDSQYMSVPARDQLGAQIPAFIEKTGLIGFIAGLPLARGASAGVTTTYAVARPVLPLRHADLRIRDTVITPGSVAGMRRASAELRDHLTSHAARLSPCAQALAYADAEAIAEGLGLAACVIPPSQPDGLTSGQVNVCRAALEDLLDQAYMRASTCRDTPPLSGEDVLLRVDKEFTELIGSLRESRRTGDFRLANSPRTRYSLGVLSSAIIGTPRYSKSTVRAKVGSNGALVVDPMPTVLTMALVNIHPRPYDPQQDSATWAERFRFFAGTAVTPDFGIGGGAGIMIVRGLTANVGWATLFVKSPRAGFAIGQMVPAGKTPLGASRAGVWFAGLSYSFR